MYTFSVKNVHNITQHLTKQAKLLVYALLDYVIANTPG